VLLFLTGPKVPRELPIVVDGKLLDEAVSITIGYMFYPEDELAARQFYHLVREELLADAATPSSLFKV
jgi:hypothetical protein